MNDNNVAINELKQELQKQEKITRKSIKISIFSSLVAIFFVILNLAVLLTYVSGLVGISKKMDVIQMQIEIQNK